MGQIKVFLSSTCYDLKQIRSDMFDFLINQGFSPILSEYPNFPVNPRKNTVENCIENVRINTDIFVLIIGNRYGYQIETGKSITNTEYLLAKQLGIPIYVFIYKPILTMLPFWKKNKDGDFSDNVDSIKIFEFVEILRESDKNWCFEFEKANDIIEILKIQFSHLFKETLDLQKKFNANLPKFYKKLSPSAINILLKREDLFEILFFAQTLEDELSKFEELKFDLNYQILFGCKQRIDDFHSLEKWLNQNMESLNQFATAGENLMNKAFQQFYGEPGTPSDLKGLYYVSNALSRLFGEMINWYNNIKSTSVPDDFISLRNNFAEYTIKSANRIWDFAQEIKFDIMDGRERLSKGEKGPIEIQTILTMDVDENSTKNFHQEMDRLINLNK